MATIALYAREVNQMPELVRGIKSAVNDYKTELLSLQMKAYSIGTSTCNLDDVVASIQSSTKTQEEKVESFDALEKETEEFIENAVTVDRDVADVINKQRNEFYEQYAYLKPECEKNAWDKFCDGVKSVGEWCKEHWGEILVTMTIVIGAVFAIAAVFVTGGMALVPLLAVVLTSFGVSATTAFSIATISSLLVAGVTIFSTLISTTLNIIDTWSDIDEDSVFKTWQTAMNWISAISNGFYSIGSIYNSIRGITNKGLKSLSKILNGKNQFISQLSTIPNNSAFWSGWGKGGDEIARDLVSSAGKETLEMSLEKAEIVMPDWNVSKSTWQSASSAWAWNSSGEVVAFLGEKVSTSSVWRTFEYPLLQINPNVTKIMDVSGSVIKYFSLSSFVTGTGNIVGLLLNLEELRGKINADY